MSNQSAVGNRTINPTSLPKPSGYAHGILAGNTVFLGGQTALDKDMNIVPGGIVEQFTQAFSNVLDHAGGSRRAARRPGQRDHLPHGCGRLHGQRPGNRTHLA